MEMLSPLQEKIMKCLWVSEEPLSLKDLSDKFDEFSYTTISNQIAKLRKKGFIGVECIAQNQGQRNNYALYGVRISYGEYLHSRAENQNLFLLGMEEGLMFCTKQQRKALKDKIEMIDKEEEQ